MSLLTNKYWSSAAKWGTVQECFIIEKCVLNYGYETFSICSRVKIKKAQEIM